MPRKTLVLSSGGILGVVYGGAFRSMEERGISIGEFEVVYGTSIGALVGFLVVLGLGYRAIRGLMISLPMDTLLQINSHSLLRVADTCGLDSGRQLRKLIRSVCYRVLRHERPTMGELYQLTGKIFTVNAVDLRTGQVVYFGTTRTPEVFVEDAICASAAIPFLYAPVRIHEMVLVDGAIGEALMLRQVPPEDIPTTIALVPTPKMEGTVIETVMDVMRCSYTTQSAQSLTNLINSCSQEAGGRIVRIFTPVDSAIMLDGTKSNSSSIREMLDFIGYTETARSPAVAEFIKTITDRTSLKDLVPSGRNVEVLAPKPPPEERVRPIEPMTYNPDPLAPVDNGSGLSVAPFQGRDDGGTDAVYRPRVSKGRDGGEMSGGGDGGVQEYTPQNPPTESKEDSGIRRQPMFDPRGPVEETAPRPRVRFEGLETTEPLPHGINGGPPRSLPPPLKTRESGGPAVAPVSYRPSV